MSVRPLFVLVLTGCPALSDADLRHRIDRDNDGVVSEAFGGFDCVDDNAAIHPGAAELCDGVDNDCDGLFNADDLDMPAEEVSWFLDADGDGFGRDDDAIRTCAALPGYVHVGGDCDDTDSEQRPEQTWYLDGDGDEYGLLEHTRMQCERPSAYTVKPGDCDDANGRVHPDAPEVCNLVDDDCNRDIDVEDEGITGVFEWFPDVDGDGYGEDGAGEIECFPLDTDVLRGGDCDDGAAGVHPGAPETWYNDVDQDCSGGSDNDQDGDGADAVAKGGDDCDDLRSWINPSAAEVCDGAANRCEEDSWTSSDEDGLATFVPASGLLPIDELAALTSGGTVTLVEDGTLFLCTGTWTGQVVVTGGTVALVAPAGSGTATLDAGGLGPVVDASGVTTALTVRDLALTGGTGHLTAGGDLIGGCLYAGFVESVELTRADLSGCSADAGGGAWIQAATVIVDQSVFSDNSATGDGGSLYAGMGLGSRIAGSVFDQNDAAEGGGAYLLAPAAPGLTMLANTFQSNTAGTGGGILLASGMLDLEAGEFADNVATEGGAIHTLGDLKCASGTAFLRNTDDAIRIEADGTLAANSCNFAPLGADDNAIDVASPAGSFQFDGFASALCDRFGCTP